MLSKEDHTSVGLQSWGGSILAERICLQPSLFSLTVPNDINDRPLRILELGTGTGMLSIVTAKILQSSNPAPEIIATDYHPEVLDNLAKNVATNFPKFPAITIECLDWELPYYHINSCTMYVLCKFPCCFPENRPEFVYIMKKSTVHVMG